MMTGDTDPMLGDEATRQAYIEEIKAKMADAVQEVRAERRAAVPVKETEPVMLGMAGFNGGISAG